MADRQSLEYRGRLTPEAAAGYLESVARGLREGQITIERDGEIVESEVADEVSLEVEAEANSKGRFTLSLEIDWRLRRANPVPPILISSQRPARPDAAAAGTEPVGYTPE